MRSFGRRPQDDLSIAVVALLLFSACAGSHSRLKIGQSSNGEVVEADGAAPYNAADILATKRSSLVDAQKNAVEKAVGVFVSGRTMVEKAVAIENNILARTDGYVKKYDIVKEWQDGGLYYTRIRALVALKDLQQDLKEMSLLGSTELSRPHVAVNITEKIQKDIVEEKPASTALQKELTDNGYNIAATEKDSIPPDLVIKGTASAYPFQAEGLGGFVSYRARLTVDVTRPGTSKSVASVTQEASGLGGNAELAGLKSLEVVGHMVGEELSEELAKVWTNQKTIYLAVEAVGSFAEVDRIKKHIASQPGVKDLVLRTYDDNLAQFEVELGDVTPTELATHLEASQVVALKVIEARPDSIRLTTK